MNYDILYEDECCLIVNKPSNLILHHSHFARNIQETSLVEGLRDLTGISELSPIHRLDRKTSGLVVFAKQKSNVSLFQAEFSKPESKKIYWALMRGFVPEFGSIDSPVKNEKNNYKEAKTEYKTLLKIERNFEIPPYATQRYSVVELLAVTGRYHQLRQHANKIAHPIINDPKHGNRHHNHYFAQVLNIPFLFLHAYSLELENPISGKVINVKAPLPPFWKEFLNEDFELFCSTSE